MDLEVLEAMKLDQSQTGVGKGRGEFRYGRAHSTGGLQDPKRKGETCFLTYSFCMHNVFMSHACHLLFSLVCVMASWYCMCSSRALCAVVIVSSVHDSSIHASPLPAARSPGPSPPVSPPVSNPPRCQYSRSLSEARFNALRLEYQEYRRTQESTRSREPCLSPGLDTDSDSGSALL